MSSSSSIYWNVWSLTQRLAGEADTTWPPSALHRRLRRTAFAILLDTGQEAYHDVPEESRPVVNAQLEAAELLRLRAEGRHGTAARVSWRLDELSTLQEKLEVTGTNADAVARLVSFLLLLRRQGKGALPANAPLLTATDTIHTNATNPINFTTPWYSASVPNAAANVPSLFNLIPAQPTSEPDGIPVGRRLRLQPPPRPLTAPPESAPTLGPKPHSPGAVAASPFPHRTATDTAAVPAPYSTGCGVLNPLAGAGAGTSTVAAGAAATIGWFPFRDSAGLPSEPCFDAPLDALLLLVADPNQHPPRQQQQQQHEGRGAVIVGGGSNCGGRVPHVIAAAGGVPTQPLLRAGGAAAAPPPPLLLGPLQPGAVHTSFSHVNPLLYRLSGTSTECFKLPVEDAAAASVTTTAAVAGPPVAVGRQGDASAQDARGGGAGVDMDVDSGGDPGGEEPYCGGSTELMPRASAPLSYDIPVPYALAALGVGLRQEISSLGGSSSTISAMPSLGLPLPPHGSITDGPFEASLQLLLTADLDRMSVTPRLGSGHPSLQLPLPPLQSPQTSLHLPLPPLQQAPPSVQLPLPPHRASSSLGLGLGKPHLEPSALVSRGGSGSIRLPLAPVSSNIVVWDAAAAPGGGAQPLQARSGSSNVVGSSSNVLGVLDASGGGGGPVRSPLEDEVLLYDLTVMALQGVEAALRMLRSGAIRSHGIRLASQRSLLTQLCETGELRLRLGGFVAAYGTYGTTAAAPRRDDALAAFADSVRELLALYDRELQELAAVNRRGLRAARQVRTATAAAAAASSGGGGGKGGRAYDSGSCGGPGGGGVRPRTGGGGGGGGGGLLGLFLCLAPLRVHLQRLADVCMCVPDPGWIPPPPYNTTAAASGVPGHGGAGGGGGGVRRGGCELGGGGGGAPLAPSLWQVYGFRTGSELLDWLYGALLQTDHAKTPLLRLLFTAACTPYLRRVRAWMYDPVAGGAAGPDGGPAASPPPPQPTFAAPLQPLLAAAGLQMRLLEALDGELRGIAERIRRMAAAEAEEARLIAMQYHELPGPPSQHVVHVPPGAAVDSGPADSAWKRPGSALGGPVLGLLLGSVSSGGAGGGGGGRLANGTHGTGETAANRDGATANPGSSVDEFHYPLVFGLEALRQLSEAAGAAAAARDAELSSLLSMLDRRRCAAAEAADQRHATAAAAALAVEAEVRAAKAAAAEERRLVRSRLLAEQRQAMDERAARLRAERDRRIVEEQAVAAEAVLREHNEAAAALATELARLRASYGGASYSESGAAALAAGLLTSDERASEAAARLRRCEWREARMALAARRRLFWQGIEAEELEQLRQVITAARGARAAAAAATTTGPGAGTGPVHVEQEQGQEQRPTSSPTRPSRLVVPPLQGTSSADAAPLDQALTCQYDVVSPVCTADGTAEEHARQSDTPTRVAVADSRRVMTQLMMVPNSPSAVSPHGGSGKCTTLVTALVSPRVLEPLVPPAAGGPGSLQLPGVVLSTLRQRTPSTPDFQKQRRRSMYEGPPWPRHGGGGHVALSSCGRTSDGDFLTPRSPQLGGPRVGPQQRAGAIQHPQHHRGGARRSLSLSGTGAFSAAIARTPFATFNAATFAAGPSAAGEPVPTWPDGAPMYGIPGAVDSIINLTRLDSARGSAVRQTPPPRGHMPSRAAMLRSSASGRVPALAGGGLLQQLQSRTSRRRWALPQEATSGLLDIVQRPPTAGEGSGGVVSRNILNSNRRLSLGSISVVQNGGGEGGSGPLSNGTGGGGLPGKPYGVRQEGSVIPQSQVLLPPSPSARDGQAMVPVVDWSSAAAAAVAEAGAGMADPGRPNLDGDDATIGGAGDSDRTRRRQWQVPPGPSHDSHAGSRMPYNVSESPVKALLQTYHREATRHTATSVRQQIMVSAVYGDAAGDRNGVGVGMALAEDLAYSPVGVAVQTCLYGTVLAQYRLTTRAVWHVLVHEYHLLSYCLALRRFFFCEAGDVAGTLAESLVRRTEVRPHPPPSTAELHAMMEEALQPSSMLAAGAAGRHQYRGGGGGDTAAFAAAHGDSAAGTSAQDGGNSQQRVGRGGGVRGGVVGPMGEGEEDVAVATALTVRSVPGRKLGTGGYFTSDVMLVTCKVPAPLDAVIHPEVLTSYADIFSVLLRVRCAAAGLGACWAVLNAATSGLVGRELRPPRRRDTAAVAVAVAANGGPGRRRRSAAGAPAVEEAGGAGGGGGGVHPLWLKRLALARLWLQAASQIVSLLMQYLQVELQGQCWEEFSAALTGPAPRDLVHMREAHNRYLETARAICMLPPHDPPPPDATPPSPSPPPTLTGLDIKMPPGHNRCPSSSASSLTTSRANGTTTATTATNQPSFTNPHLHNSHPSAKLPAAPLMETLQCTHALATVLRRAVAALDAASAVGGGAALSVPPRQATVTPVQSSVVSRSVTMQGGLGGGIGVGAAAAAGAAGLGGGGGDRFGSGTGLDLDDLWAAVVACQTRLGQAAGVLHGTLRHEVREGGGGGLLGELTAVLAAEPCRSFAAVGVGLGAGGGMRRG